MPSPTLKQLLTESGCLIEGTHVLYASGRHGDTYFNKNLLFANPRYMDFIGSEFAKSFSGDSFDAVIGPVTGGAILSSWTAHHASLTTGRTVASLYADKACDGFVVKRGYGEYLRGKKVLVVEDVITTGGSVMKVLREVENHGGKVAGVAVICNRAGITKNELGKVPKLVSLISLNLTSYAPAECPLCAKGVPLSTELGHAKK